MYSLGVRRGIGRGRIWHTSALYSNSKFVGDDILLPAAVEGLSISGSGSRGFHSSGRLEEDDSKDGPRAIPKMSFADLIKAKLGRAPTPAAPAPQAEPPTTPPVQQTQPQSSSPFNTSQYPHPRSMDPPAPRSQPQRQAQPGPRITRAATRNRGFEDMNLQDIVTQPADEGTAVSQARQLRRAARRPRPAQNQAEGREETIGMPEGSQTPAERQAAYAARAYAQAHSAVPRGSQNTRFVSTRGRGGGGVGGSSWQRKGDAEFVPGMGMEAYQRQQHNQQSHLMARSLTPAGAAGGASSSFAVRMQGFGAMRPGMTPGQRGRGRGRGGARGRGAGRGGRGRRGKMTKNQREQRQNAKKLMEKEWVETTGNPKRGDPDEIEPHPVYDTDKPYFPSLGDLTKWVPAVGGGAGLGAQKLLNYKKPSHEPIVAWGEKVLLGGGIMRPGEGVQEARGGADSERSRELLRQAERAVRTNASYTDKNQVQFLNVLRSKLGEEELKL